MEAVTASREAGANRSEVGGVVDVTVASFEEMEPIYDGLARRARASLGVTGWGMQVMTLPPNWDGYPNHRHDANVEDALERLYLLYKIDRGIKQADAGELISQEEARQRMAKWLHWCVT